jgi:hypothetical protein
MPSSEILRRAALVRTDVLEEFSASIIKVTRVGELRTMLAVTSNRRMQLVTANVVLSSTIIVTLMMEALRSPKRRFLQGQQGETSQKMSFFRIFLFLSNPALQLISMSLISHVRSSAVNSGFNAWIS